MFEINIFLKNLYNELMKVAFLDIDKTLYNGYLFYEWARYMENKGIFSFIDFAKFQEIGVFYELGAVDYTKAATMTSEVIGEVLKDNKFDVVIKHTQNFIDSVKNRYFDYSPAIIKYLKKQGYLIVFVTTEPDFLAEMVKAQIGGDDAIGIDYTVKEGLFTGELTNDLFSQFGKANTVSKFAKEHGLNMEECFSMGDSEGDIEMLKLTGRSVIINTSGQIKELIRDTKIIQARREMVLEDMVMTGV